MAEAIRRDDDPHLILEILELWIADIKSVVDSAAIVAGEGATAERRTACIDGLIDVARRLVKHAQQDLDRYNAATCAQLLRDRAAAEADGGAS